MTTLQELIESEICDFFAGFGSPGEPETPEEMQSQLLSRVMPLLAGMGKEPVAWTSQRSLDVWDKITAFTDEKSASDYGKRVSWSEVVPLYAAPQLPQPALPDGLRLALSNAGIAAPESDEMLFATHEKYIQLLVSWVKERKPFKPAAVPDAISTRQAISKMEECEPCDSINVAYKYGWNACRAAILQGASPTKRLNKDQ